MAIDIMARIATAKVISRSVNARRDLFLSCAKHIEDYLSRLLCSIALPHRRQRYPIDSVKLDAIILFQARWNGLLNQFDRPISTVDLRVFRDIWTAWRSLNFRHPTGQDLTNGVFFTIQTACVKTIFE